MKRLFTFGLAVIISIPVCIAAYRSQTAKHYISPDVKAANIEAEIAKIEAKTEPMVQLTIENEKVPEIGTEEATEGTKEDYYKTTPFVPYDFIPLDAELQVNIYTICKEYEIAYDLILAVIKTESEFRWVTGDNGQAVGYMQIWPYWWQGTADKYGLDINNPADNVHLGIIILTDALDDNAGDLNKALKQYNSGNPNYPGNEYIEKVFANYEWILSKEGEQ